MPKKQTKKIPAKKKAAKKSTPQYKTIRGR